MSYLHCSLREQMPDIDLNGIPNMLAGSKFFACDNTGTTFEYQYLGINPCDETGCAYICLYNSNFGCQTDVEAEWFRQRTIYPVP